MIADFAPENFIINRDTSYGYLTNSKEGWYKALKELACSKSKRDQVAVNVYESLIIFIIKKISYKLHI